MKLISYVIVKLQALVLMAVFLVLPTQAQVNLQQGLVAYYPFNGNANDESGNGNRGVVNGATLTEDRFGNANSAYFFNGVTHYISLPALINNISIGTISIWFNPFSWNIGNHGRYFFSSARISNGDYLNIGAHPAFFSHELIAGVYGSWGWHWARSYSPPQLNNWHHVVFQWGTNGQKLYLNGVLVDTKSSTGYVTQSQTIYIGRSSWPSSHVNGKIDDIRIYNRALSEQEIYALYTEGQPPQANTISNILISQHNDGSGMVDVYFDIHGSTIPYNISLEVSFDGCSTYTAIPASFLSGDVSNISPGTNKHIVWDGMGSHPNTYSTATKLKIIAN